MTPEIEPPRFSQQDSAPGSLPVGCALGCACQIFFMLVGLAINSMTGAGKISESLVVGWGFTQWIGVAPLIFHHKEEGHPRTVQGLLISGCLGVLLSSACAGMFLLTK
jgi:hypothetical protein